MTETNTNGDKKISVKWIRPDLYDYLKMVTKKLKISETTVINQALKLHKEQSEKRDPVSRDELIEILHNRNKEFRNENGI